MDLCADLRRFGDVERPHANVGPCTDRLVEVAYHEAELPDRSQWFHRQPRCQGVIFNGHVGGPFGIFLYYRLAEADTKQTIRAIKIGRASCRARVCQYV